MDLSVRVSELQAKLNEPNNLPEKAFRRNVVVYELVCYVNIITGCLLSKNWGPISIFTERCQQFMSENKEATNSVYYSLVDEYLNLVESYIQSLTKPAE